MKEIKYLYLDIHLVREHTTRFQLATKVLENCGNPRYLCYYCWYT